MSDAPHWPDGWRAALSLSFDDARGSQLSQGRELFDTLDVPATFFVLPDAVRRDVGTWREMVERGHEVGNHSLRHPCSGNLPFTRQLPLENLSLRDIEADIDEANRQLEDTFGFVPRAFAYPCGQTFVGRGVNTRSYVPLIARRFLVGRTFHDAWPNAPRWCDLAQVTALDSDGKSFDGLRQWLDAALVEGSWVVLAGHEIGDSGPQTTFPATIKAVVGWCRTEGVHIATVGAIGETVAAMQAAHRHDAGTQESGLRPSRSSPCSSTGHGDSPSLRENGDGRSGPRK